VSRGFVLWFTGLSGSGKSTLTSMVAAELRRRGVHVETLDGDEIRKHLSRGLGFSRQDRDENIRRIGFVAKLVARSGACAIAAAISPYKDVRNEVRSTIDRFVEVYTECPLEVLANRDPKGLYKKALAGEIRNFTGVDDPYEAPEAPEVHLRTDLEHPEESVRKIVARLEELGLIPAWGRLLERTPDAVTRLVPPHGHELVDRIVRSSATEAGRDEARSLPSLVLDPATHAELVSLAHGAFSPLRGFMTSKDYLRVAREMRLESGQPWAMPVTLAVPESRIGEIRRAGALALAAAGRGVVATLTVEEVWRPSDVLDATSSASGLPSPARPDEVCVGGEVRCFDASPPAELGPWMGPREVRGELVRRGWRRVVALDTALPPVAGQEHLGRSALELADGLMIRPLAHPGGLPVALVARCYEALLSVYFAPRAGIVTPHARLREGSEQRLTIHDAIVAKNFGASGLLLGEVSSPEAHRWVECYGPNELGIEVLPARRTATSPRVGGVVTTHSAPDAPTPHDGASVLAAILSGGSAPDHVRPEVVALLSELAPHAHA
jgi:sulfate adenylyltransferase/3'-phosphoadenosine 5'-phosphosulfate synthase